MSDRNGVEIDYCPACRGVWLDRGELDKIIERNAASAAPAPDRSATARGYRGYPGEPGVKYERSRQAKKKDGIGDFLGDIFDF